MSNNSIELAGFRPAKYEGESIDYANALGVENPDDPTGLIGYGLFGGNTNAPQNKRYTLPESDGTQADNHNGQKYQLFVLVMPITPKDTVEKLRDKEIILKTMMGAVIEAYVIGTIGDGNPENYQIVWRRRVKFSREGDFDCRSMRYRISCRILVTNK